MLILVIVAPYWNVNQRNAKGKFTNHFVIVAPYWNVNPLLRLFQILDNRVIVAPYWNVNFKVDKFIQTDYML